MSNKPLNQAESILIVDDDLSIREVLVDLLEPLGFRCVVAENAEDGLDLFRKNRFRLVITDLKMPGRDGIWLIERILSHRPETAIIAISGFAETDLAVECLRRGAYDFLSKPFRANELYDAVERARNRQGAFLLDLKYRNHLEEEVAEKSEQLSHALKALNAAYQHTLESLVAALDAREQDTGNHSKRVMRYTSVIAARMGIRGPLLLDIARGALLHDIGKIGISDTILLKPGPLTEEEWVQMRRHPEIGFEIVKDIPYLRTAGEIILTHQEMFDGSGYPSGISGYKLPLGSRIFALADTIDAIQSDRCYRRGQSFEEAQKRVSSGRGTQFDPAIVDVFLSMEREVFDELRNAEGLIGFEPEIARQEGKEHNFEGQKNSIADFSCGSVLSDNYLPGNQ